MRVIETKSKMCVWWRECVCKSASVFKRKRSVHECVCVRERERERERQTDRG